MEEVAEHAGGLLCLKGEAEMTRLFAGLPEAVGNTGEDRNFDSTAQAGWGRVRTLLFDHGPRPSAAPWGVDRT